MVDFTYLEPGIKVRGLTYPVLKKDWVEGFTLNEFVKEHADQPQYLENLCQIWLRLAKRLGFDTHLHSLRHYSATELIAAGVDVRTVAGRLGHSGGGSTTLRTYSAFVLEADQRAAKALADRRLQQGTSGPATSVRAVRGARRRRGGGPGHR